MDFPKIEYIENIISFNFQGKHSSNSIHYIMKYNINYLNIKLDITFMYSIKYSSDSLGSCTRPEIDTYKSYSKKSK